MSDLPPERPGCPAPPDLAAIRGAIAQAVASGSLESDPPACEQVIGGVRCLRFSSEATPRATVIHFHGGGFRLGVPELSAAFAAALAIRCGVDVVCPDYRLAPEHPFPSALSDGIGVIRELHATATAPLILSGDSAGGGLAASLAYMCHCEQVPLAGLILLSAWLDLTVTSPCYNENAATDPLFSRAAASESAEQYLQGRPADDPLASPLFADPAHFPPTFVSIGSGEVLADDGRRFADALRAAGVEVGLSEIEGMDHTNVVRGPDLPGSAETFAAVAGFIDRLLLGSATRPSHRP